MQPHNERPSRPCKRVPGPASWLPAAAFAAVLTLGAFAPDARAQDGDGDAIPFDEAEVFFELNNTDGDLGIHAKIDGEGWRRLAIEDPNERKMLDVMVKGRLQKQGLTEFFFESAEPTFDELDPADFFDRFPEGTYEIEGLTLEGEELEGEALVTHTMPAPAGNIMVNDEEAAESCDVEDLPEVSAPVTISWDAVTDSHPDLGNSGESIEVHNYEVVVEIDETPFRTNTILPPSATQFEVPAEILELGDEIKFEILVREAASFNQTGVESCFVLTGE